MCKNKFSDEHPDPLWDTSNFVFNKKGRTSPGVKWPEGEAEISRIWSSLRMNRFTPPHPHILMASKETTNN